MKRTWALTVIVLGSSVVLAGCENHHETTSSPSEQRKLTLSKPDNLTIKQGATASLKIAISRTGFNDPVLVNFEGLPAGVELVEKDMEIAKDKTSTTFNFRANDTAQLVSNLPVIVTAIGGGLEARETFNLTIKSK